MGHGTSHVVSGPADLIETSWAGRDPAVTGRQLRAELLETGIFVSGVLGLLALAPTEVQFHPAVVAMVIAYAVAARARFAIGPGYALPTQPFLVLLFALAPAPIVPLLAFAGLALRHLGEVVLARGQPIRVVFCGGDAMHAIGPAIVISAFAGGDLLSGGPGLWLLAFAAQFVSDLGSMVLRDLLLGVAPQVEAKVLAWVWGVDVALAPLGLLAAQATRQTPWAGLAVLPLVALLSVMAADRNRRIDHAAEQLNALNRERVRRETAVQRVGDVLASDLDLDAVLDLVARAAAEALDAESGRAFQASRRARMSAVERDALRHGSETIQAENAGRFVIASAIGDPPRPFGVLSVSRTSAFSDDERALLAYLGGQAAISAEKVKSHERLRDAEARLRHQAFHDPLTELPNRARLADRVARAAGAYPRAAPG